MGPHRLLGHVDQVVVPRLARGFARISRGRLRPRLLTGAALLGVTAVLVTAVWTAHRGVAGGDLSVGTSIRVGAAQGQSAADYATAARTELAELLADPTARQGETYALVSLRAYLAPDRLTPVLGGVSVVEVYSRVPLGRIITQTVRIPAYRIPDDVQAGMRQLAARKESEAAGYEGLAVRLRGADADEAQLRAAYLSSASTASAEATAYRDGCTCVFGAVIRATPAVLDQVASRPEVRAVDAAPEVLRLDRAVFLPALPEPAQQTAAPGPVR